MKAVLIRIMHESRWQLSWDNSHQDYLQHPAWCEQWSEPTGKRQRAAGHCDFIDKQNKLFKICSLFNSKRLNTITGELKNHCSWLEFKASTELSHQSPPFSQQKNTHSVSNFSMASTNWFQMSLGLCYIWNKFSQLKGCAIWIWQNFLVEILLQQLALKRANLTLTRAVPLDRKQKTCSIYPYKQMTQTSSIIGTSRDGAATDFIASQLMCRVSTRCWLPTTQPAAAAAGFGLNCKGMDGWRRQSSRKSWF